MKIQESCSTKVFDSCSVFKKCRVAVVGAVVWCGVHDEGDS